MLELEPCRSCGLPAVPGFPHRHDSPARPDYDPMPPRPDNTAAMLAILRAEYLAELPARLHVGYVPSQAEPVAGAGEVLDAGELGSPSWSPEFHRYIGAARFLEGEMVQADGDLEAFPYARQLEGVRRWCAARHRTWYEHDGRPLCWLLLRGLVQGATLADAAQEQGVAPERARQLVAEATNKWWAWVSNSLNGLDLRRRR